MAGAFFIKLPAINLFAKNYQINSRRHVNRTTS